MAAKPSANKTKTKTRMNANHGARAASCSSMEETLMSDERCVRAAAPVEPDIAPGDSMQLKTHPPDVRENVHTV